MSSGGVALGHSPYALTVHPPAAASSASAATPDAAALDAAAAAAEAAAAAVFAEEDPVASALPAPDLARRWMQIAEEARWPSHSIAAHRTWALTAHCCVRAQAFRAVDGAADGFDSEEEVYESAEDKCALLLQRLHAKHARLR